MLNAYTAYYGSMLLVRPPPPVTLNKAGANYKSETTYPVYRPRQAFREWMAICDAIVAAGGDALFAFEPADDVFLHIEALAIDAEGNIRPSDALSSAPIGTVDAVETGRVFTANGPWVRRNEGTLHALMPHMLPHRTGEGPYFIEILTQLAEANGLTLAVETNPHRWEGMADVVLLPELALLTHTVPGRYDEHLSKKTPRSSRAGVARAAEFGGVPAAAQCFLELRYPHFHGDTVHFALRHASGAVLAHYPGGLYPGEAERLQSARTATDDLAIGADDAVDAYAANSRQVGAHLLVPKGVSPAFLADVRHRGVTPIEIELDELFGKAGGGPACATLYLPRDVSLPASHPLRYSQRRDEVEARAAQIPDRVAVDPQFYAARARG